MFDSKPSSRADLKAGTLYAVCGEAQWIYYGQVAPDKSVGFFHRRDRSVASITDILTAPVLAVIGISYPSITRALRTGGWCKLGRFDLVGELERPWPTVHWPVGRLVVSVSDGHAEYDTGVDDPAIQDMEMMASWDAERHIPARLTADFGAETAPWDVGGPIWRERKIREELARRFPESPWHQLPAEWVPTETR